MKIVFFLLSFILAASAWATPITVASWNIHNYLISDRMIGGSWVREYPKPEVEKTAIITVVRDMAPDVLAIQEIGTQIYFEEFSARLRAAGLIYPYSAHMQAIDGQRCLAVFSKIPFEAVPHRSIPFRYMGAPAKSLRGLLELRFGTPGVNDWRLFVVHLKSKLSDRADDPEATEFRVGEADAMRDLIAHSIDTGASPAYLIMGDFNDGPRSRAIKRFLTKGKTTLTTALTATDSKGEAWTHRWESEGIYSRIDLILASPPMQSVVLGAGIVDSPEVTIASDHRPIRVVVDIPDGVSPHTPLKGHVAP